jgi:TolB-like protein
LECRQVPHEWRGRAPFGVPTVAILPFVNVTGDPQYESLTQRIGQKMRDDASNASIWRVVGRSAGTGGADPIDAGRQLNADYVATGNLEAGGDPLRVTLQLADVHSSARLWSQTISPVLEKPNTAAAEAEVAGRAESLIDEAIVDAERTRLSSVGDITKTTWGCVLLGFNPKPDTAASARECLEAAVQREPSNRMCGNRSSRSSTGRGFGVGGCLPRRRVSRSASISPTGSCRRRCTLKIWRP